MRAERDLKVDNRAGIHLRVASQIVKLLNDFDCHVSLAFNGRSADAKSIMGITQLMAPTGSVLHFSAEGPQARRAAVELERLFHTKFGED